MINLLSFIFVLLLFIVLIFGITKKGAIFFQSTISERLSTTEIRFVCAFIIIFILVFILSGYFLLNNSSDETFKHWLIYNLGY